MTFPGRRKVFVNGNYTDSQTIECTITVEYGLNFFETVNGDDCIDYRGSVRTNDGNKHCRLALEAVIPPEGK